MPNNSIDSTPDIIKQANWIWPDSSNWDLHNCYALFRHDFELVDIPDETPLYISADQSYQLYINGQYVCRGPARGFQNSWPYDCIDVHTWLKKGNNLIAIRAYNPGFSNFQYLSQGYAGLLVAAEWGSTRIFTGKGWTCRRQSGVSKDTVPTSIQLFGQESVDLNIEDSDWACPGYNDSDWNNKPASMRYNSMPWFSLEPRSIPMLEEREHELGSVIGTAIGISKPGYLGTRNLTQNRYEEGLAHESFNGECVALQFESTSQGKWSSRLIDLGKLYIGNLMFDIEGCEGGEVVECHHFETLSPGTLEPDYAPNVHCRMAFSSRLYCRPGVNLHTFYHAIGSRYLVITVRDSLKPLTVRFKLRSAIYPMNIRGNFISSDTQLNAIWDTCMWTQRVCSLDAYVDTPWREQAQWWGDARVQSWNTFHLCNDSRLLRRGIRQIASQTTPDGVTYGHAPTMAHNCVLPDFTLIWMLTLWDHYWQTGSLDAFIEHQPTLQKALEYFEKWTCPKSGLLEYDPRFWLFLDWTDLRKEGYSSVYSLWYLHALDRMATLYGLVSDNRMATTLQERARTLRENLQKLIGSSGLMCDGYTTTGDLDPECSVHTQTLAIITGLAPAHRAVMLEKSLLSEATGKNHGKARPSAYWITYVYDVLSESGYAKEVIDDISKRWRPMVEHGTTWEHFQPKRGIESFSHAWSAHPLFHLMRILGGIRQAAPAWREIMFTPCFIGTHADVTIPTPQGEIRSTWERKGQFIKGNLALPANVNARIRLPGHAETNATGNYGYEVPIAK